MRQARSAAATPPCPLLPELILLREPRQRWQEGLTQVLGVLQVVELPGFLVAPDHAGDFCCDCKWH